MFQPFCRFNPSTIAQSHPICLHQLLSVKCTNFIPLVLGDPRHNGRSRKGEPTTYPYLLPCTRALVRRGDEDGNRQMQQDEMKDADEKLHENSKKIAAKRKRRPMR